MELIKQVLSEYGIDQIGYVSAGSFDFIYPHLLPSHDIKGAFVFLIPYKYSPAYKDNINISKYARAYDYHYFAEKLYHEVIPKLEEKYCGSYFHGCCDCSPINEKLAAAKAGLGIIGRNSLLINEIYGSYCFIGSILTDYVPIHKEYPVSYCEQCMRCVQSCPANALENYFPDSSKCLSAISQSKKRTSADFDILRKNGIVWGCDKCQDVCPHNIGAKDTDIPFFKSDLVTNISYDMIVSMPEEEFKKRAFAWRGRKVILENLSNLTQV